MIIKKFQGATETDAIMAAKDEFGSNAVVMNIKTVKPKGIFKLFRKGYVEVTAALEENAATSATSATVDRSRADKGKTLHVQTASVADSGSDMGDEDSKAIEEKLQKLQAILEKQVISKEKAQTDIFVGGSNIQGGSVYNGYNSTYGNIGGMGIYNEEAAQETTASDNTDMKNIPCLKLVYNKLIDNDVDEMYANQIIGEVERSLSKEAPIDSVLAAAYQRIVLKLGEPVAIEAGEGKKIVFLVGPTGVGKTTTIAKLASSLKLNKKAKIALMTSDTYRIAAVEQLNTYANILEVPITVLYTENEVNDEIEKLKDYDIILVDTAGRSHKDSEQCAEVLKFYNAVDSERTGFEKSVYLVLSASTKYSDLVRITKVYESLGDYNIIFTKLDETFEYGNIINIAMHTGKSISYTTFGQNVPDDIDVIDVQNIAKQLLGGGE